MSESHGGGEGRDREDLEAFEEKQRRELEAFQAQQRREAEAFEAREERELESFEKHQERELEEFERREHQEFVIKIDRTEYKVREHELTGAQLRALASPPIGPERDLFEVVPGGSDRKIADDMVVKMRDGLRFFTAPAQINPGSI